LKINISAFVLNYNHEKYLERSITSILEHDIKVNQILIIDDNSRKQSDLNILLKDKRIKLIKNSKNMGRGYCRNLALNYLTDTYLLCLDASNYIKPGFIQKALSNFTSDQICAVSGLINNDPNTMFFAKKWRCRHLFKQEHNFGDSIHFAKSLTTYGTVFKRNALINVGNFNPLLRHSEDKDLGKRLLDANYKIIGDPQLIVYSMKKDTILSVLERYWRWYCGTNEKFQLKDYWHAFKASFRPMIQEDIKDNDWKSALISFLCPHYGYCRYLFRKLTGKIQKHS
jgi:GT2 family glycosyltransferase